MTPLQNWCEINHFHSIIIDNEVKNYLDLCLQLTQICKTIWSPLSESLRDSVLNQKVQMLKIQGYVNKTPVFFTLLGMNFF